MDFTGVGRESKRRCSFYTHLDISEEKETTRPKGHTFGVIDGQTLFLNFGTRLITLVLCFLLYTAIRTNAADVSKGLKYWLIKTREDNTYTLRYQTRLAFRHAKNFCDRLDKLDEKIDKLIAN